MVIANEGKADQELEQIVEQKLQQLPRPRIKWIDKRLAGINSLLHQDEAMYVRSLVRDGAKLKIKQPLQEERKTRGNINEVYMELKQRNEFKKQ